MAGEPRAHGCSLGPEGARWRSVRDPTLAASTRPPSTLRHPPQITLPLLTPRRITSPSSSRRTRWPRRDNGRVRRGRSGRESAESLEMRPSSRNGRRPDACWLTVCTAPRRDRSWRAAPEFANGVGTAGPSRQPRGKVESTHRRGSRPREAGDVCPGSCRPTRPQRSAFAGSTAKCTGSGRRRRRRWRGRRVRRRRRVWRRRSGRWRRSSSLAQHERLSGNRQRGGSFSSGVRLDEELHCSAACPRTSRRYDPRRMSRDVPGAACKRCHLDATRPPVLATSADARSSSKRHGAGSCVSVSRFSLTVTAPERLVAAGFAATAIATEPPPCPDVGLT